MAHAPFCASAGRLAQASVFLRSALGKDTPVKKLFALALIGGGIIFGAPMAAVIGGVILLVQVFKSETGYYD